MKIGITGLGLIGGSMAKAIKETKEHTVYGYDTDESTLLAAENLGYKTIVLAGGVSANSELRTRLKAECNKKGYSFYRPELKYCGDNAAMVGVQSYYEYLSGNTANENLNAYATMPIDNIIK